MKINKIGIYIYMGVVMLFFSLQVKSQKMVTYSNIKVGDTVPDFQFENLTNYNVLSKKLSDFKEKLVIIDFWATWCAPCVGMLPRMDSLMNEYKDDLLFISVTKEARAKAQDFLKKHEANLNRHFTIPVIYEDKALNKLFPNYLIPHYVWLNPKNRKVIAITNYLEINRENIDVYLKTGQNNIKTTKIDSWLAYDFDQELLLPYLNKNFDLRKFKAQYSFFSEFIPNLKRGIWSNHVDSTKDARILVKNLPIKHLFVYAFGEGQRFYNDVSIVIESKDSTIIDHITNTPISEWEVTNCYNYELYLPFTKPKHTFNVMREDLKKFIPQYHAEIQKRKARCWVLTSTGDNRGLKTAGAKWSVSMDQFGFSATNAPFETLIVQMNFNNPPKDVIVISDVSLDFNVDIVLEVDDFTNIDKVNLALEKYNLRFIDKITETDILVIKDNVVKAK